MVVLDGGLSNALEDRGHDLSDALWTARLLRDDPTEIAAVHRAYYRAGARVATTASYQAGVPGFVAAGATAREARRLITRSVTLAQEVRDELAGDGIRRWVAASIGPYGATLADGSEYTGHYGLTRTALRDFHLPRLELVARAAPDLLAVETIPDLQEAEVLVEALDQIGLPAWFSYSVQGDRTRAGQPLKDALAVAASARSVVAVGVNCCDPGDVLPALECVHAVTDKPGVVYPNSGERWEPVARRWIGPVTYDVQRVPGWVAEGARYVGGCCRVGPSQIAAVAAALG